ncbi:hypothetical protein C6A87_004485 [Mycobacterium sp. ITM-2016-00317]|uniref:hypothetical protein n=1 Tax=Mycobacterium sp. ITM-2016-00317 TaxID=2099694 RepID=UPI00287F9438|nr:hypothetical protein [Mycobacterium sp. ITM-2016-00317]WNG88505.1 hypothetical protein C6A87_004485 [Mycobacterium sp. ITM-2016-00317]
MSSRQPTSTLWCRERLSATFALRLLMPSVGATAARPAMPSRSEIDGWVLAIDGLSASAEDFRAAANRLESSADSHVQQMLVPGGTAWEGDAADAAHESAYADRGVIYRAAGHLREMARVANSGAQDLNLLRDRALDAISEAEMDSFKVTDQLAVIDTGDTCPARPRSWRHALLGRGNIRNTSQRALLHLLPKTRRSEPVSVPVQLR